MKHFRTALRSTIALVFLSLSAHADEPIELVESAPLETSLAHADLPKAADVWLAMIQGAKTSLDFAEFYAVDKPESRLTPIVHALEAAGRRGVKIRFFVDAGFAKKETGILAQLEKLPGVTLLRLDWAGKTGGGVHHAKYFIVDGREAYLGSQNFDWRSLDHIQELGLRVRVPSVVEALHEIFETDWALGTGAPKPSFATTPTFPFPVQTSGGPLEVTFEASPPGHLPDEGEWGLPKLVALIDSARVSVRVQVLTYRATQGGKYFSELESALRRAAARGAKVELLVADWSKSPGIIEGLKSLTVLPGITVKLITVPQWSGGFIPYARVAHAKYLVVDGQRGWVGTSNWERSYFYDTRNVGLIVEGASFAGKLDRFFLDEWNGPYAAVVDPCAAYTPPHVGP